MTGKSFKPIKVPMYDWWVFVANSEEELKELSEEWNFVIDEDSTHGCKAYCMPMEFLSGKYKGKEFNILYFDPKHLSVGTIVHECVHSIHFMMKSRGIPVRMCNTEVMAYGTEYLVNEVVKRCIV